MALINSKWNLWIAVCKTFDLLHFWSTELASPPFWPVVDGPKRGGGHGPNGAMVNMIVFADIQAHRHTDSDHNAELPYRRRSKTSQE